MRNGPIDAYYFTRIGPRCTMGRAEVLEASLHLGSGPGARTRVVLKMPLSTGSSRSGQRTRIW